MKTLDKILQFGIDEMNNVLPNETYGCDLHNEIYNSVFLIETLAQAENMLNEYGLEKAILEVKNYEIENFGARMTCGGSNRKTCNMLIYIHGEEFLYNCETVLLNWDNLLTAENIQQIKNELKKQSLKKEIMKPTKTELKTELKRYKKAYKILICYFDSINEDEQIKVLKKLNKINL